MDICYLSSQKKIKKLADYIKIYKKEVDRTILLLRPLLTRSGPSTPDGQCCLRKNLDQIRWRIIESGILERVEVSKEENSVGR